MKLRGLFVLLCWAAIAVTTSGQAGTAQEMLEAARKTAVLDGDCVAAIKQYQAIVTRFEKTDRAAAARALLGMAECHERSGSIADALLVYGQIIRGYKEFAAVVAEASGRTAALNQGSAARMPVERLALTVPALDDAISQVSRDGRYVVIARYGGITGQGARLDGVLHDLRTGAQRLVIQGTPTEPFFWPMSASLSKDGRHLAYVAKFDRARGQTVWQVRIAELNGSGVPTGRVIAETVTAGGTCSFIAYKLFDWTADGHSVAIRYRMDEGTQQLGLMSTGDGSVRVLKTMAGRNGPFAGALSPDGRYLAAEIEEQQGATSLASAPRRWRECNAVTRDISIFPVDGGPEASVIQFPGDDRLMGWSPDGRAILFTSARGGDSALWMHRLGQGRVVAETETIRAGFRPTRSVGLTEAGHLYTLTEAEVDQRIKEATFDFATGSFTSALSDMPLPFLRSNRSPRWSPDGRWLAYISDRAFSARMIVLRSTDTGASRELEVSFDFGASRWTWSPDSRALVMVGGPPAGPVAAGRTGLSLIDMASGAISPLGTDARAELPEWSADGRTMFYDRVGATAGPATAARMARELMSKSEREIGPAGTRLSPDGRKAYAVLGSNSDRRLVERDVAAGTERDLLKLSADFVEWHLLSQGGVIVAVSNDAATQETVLTIYSLADASTKTLRLRPSRLRVGLLAPDHRSLIVRQGTNEAPFWWVPLDGRSPKRLTELERFGRVNALDLHPDGRRLAIGVSFGLDPGHQLRVLENILPPARR